MSFDIVLGRSESDRKKLGLSGTVFLGRQYVKMAQTTSLANNVYMDIANAHVLFVCGKRGSGKCVTGDTLITLNDGRQVPIKDLQTDDHDILCLDERLKMRSSAKSDFFKRWVEEVLKVTLRSGKQITLTPEHPLLTVTGWKPVEALSAGSRIATPRTVPSFGEHILPEHEAKLLAYLLAEGHLGNGFVLFSNSDPDIVSDFKHSVERFDTRLAVLNHSHPDCYRVINPSRHRDTQRVLRDASGQFVSGSRFDSKSSIRHWLEELELYGLKSPKKFIPDAIMSAPKATIALFLNRLFSCDGSIYKTNNNWQVCYCSTSRQLAMQVHHLLLRFGILSKVRTKRTYRHDAHEIVISGAEVLSFINEIGFFGTKQERAQRALAETPRKSNPNVDTIPSEIWDHYRPSSWVAVGEALGYESPKAARTSIAYSPSRQKLLQIAEVDHAQDLMLLANSDIFWDEIIAVEAMRGSFEVYDLSVPTYHNFVANDIIIHNSYTMGAIAEGLADIDPEIKQNLSIIMIDTMGIYWTMKYPNHQDEAMLKTWGFQSKGLDVMIYTPAGYYATLKKEGVPTDRPFSIKPAELTPEDWFLTFEINPNSPIGVLIERVVLELGESGVDYDIEDIIKRIRADTRADAVTKDGAENRFLATTHWGVFSKDGTPIRELAHPGQVTVLDVSIYATMPGGWKIKALVLGIVAMRLFVERMKERKIEEFKSIESAMHYLTKEAPTERKMPLVWLVIDEAHEFLPREGKVASTDALVTLLREGRQPGLSMILATQQPGKIHTDVMTQSDILLSHRITAKIDTEALGALMQSYLRTGLDKELNNLPRDKGSALVVDDTNEKMYPIKVRPRFTWHGGSSPTAIPQKKQIFGGL